MDQICNLKSEFRLIKVHKTNAYLMQFYMV